MRMMKILPLVSTIVAAAAMPLVAQNQSSVLPNIADKVTLPIGGLQQVVHGAPPPTGPAPRLPDGTPDLSGTWIGGGSITDIAAFLAPGGTLPLLPEARKLKEARQAKDDPEVNCLPTGVPRTFPYPWRLVQYPTHTAATHIFFLFEGNIHSYRQIFMDGRPHPADLDPTWYGHSIGRWDGDTLVVDTVGYNDKFWFDFVGTPHTERLHTVERWTRQDLGHLVNEFTVEDPGAYSRPFTVTFTAFLRPGEELMEYICQENEQDTAHLSGPAIPPLPVRPAQTGR